MTKSDQIGINIALESLSLPDWEKLETELRQRFGGQGLMTSHQFALTQN